MNLEVAEKLALSLMSKQGLLSGALTVRLYSDEKSRQGVLRIDSRIWQFKWLSNNASMLHGLCDFKLGLIKLSKSMVAANHEEQVCDIILHEIAHAKSPGANHGPGFLAACKEVGCIPEQFASCDLKLGMRWWAICPLCKEKHFRATVRRKHGQFCTCVSVKLQYSQNPAGLIWELNPAYRQVEEELMAHAKKVTKKVAKKVTKKAATPKKATKTKAKGETVSSMARALILKGQLKNPEIADVIREKLGSNTTTASVAWYRSQMRKEGLIPKVTKKVAPKKTTKKKATKKKATKKATPKRVTVETKGSA